jgi:hypothetical protein
MTTPITPVYESADQVLMRAFAPMHKRALGLATGMTAGLVVFLLTAFHVVVQPVNGLPIELLAQFFYGYQPTWAGACIGSWWAFVAGFAAGWFAAFVRNLAVAVWLMVVRMKANLAQTHDFLDHI